MNLTVENVLQEESNILFNQTTVFVLLLTFAINYIFFRHLCFFKRKQYPNGPWGLPIFGHLTLLGKCPPETFEKWRKQYGDVFRIRMGSWKTVVLNGYEAVKEAAAKDDDFSSRPEFVSQIVALNMYGEQALSLGPFNQTYLEHRKLTAAALRKFTNRSGNVTENLIVEKANRLVDALLAKDYSEPRDITPDIHYAVGNIIYQFLYGVRKEIDAHTELRKIIASANKFDEFTKSENPFEVIPWLQYLMPWKVDQFAKIMTENDGTRQRQIKEHFETFSKDNINDITDAFLVANLEVERKTKSQRLTRERLLSTLGDLQGAGFDTTSKTLQWLVLYMASYPDVQRRVQSEIDDVIGSGNAIQLKDRAKLMYTDATIYEVMRVTSLVPFALPRCTTKDTKLNGYDIDKNTVVYFNLYSVSHEKEFWGDPENFRPSRFLTSDNTLDKKKCAHVIPFGLGRRRCVGEFLAKIEIFVLFVSIMRKCSFVKPSTIDLDLEPVRYLVYAPKPFKITVKER